MGLANAINAGDQGVQYQSFTGEWTGIDGLTANYVLTSNGPGSIPSFKPGGAPSGGVVVNQYRVKSSSVIEVTKSLVPTQTPTTSNTQFLNSITLTPANASNILVFEWCIPYSSATSGMSGFIFNGSTFVTGVPSFLIDKANLNPNNDFANASGYYYTTAGTTSPITFNLYVAAIDGIVAPSFLINGVWLTQGPMYGANGTAYTFTITEISPGGTSNPLTPITPVTFSESPYTVLATDQFLSVDTAGGAITLNFPNSTSAGRGIIVKDATGHALANNITYTTPGGVVLFDGATSGVLNTNYQSNTFVFSGTKYEII